MAEELKSDVCVIGAGPAGAVVASGLAARGVDVIVVEQGERVGAEARSRLVETRLEAMLAGSTLFTRDFDTGTAARDKAGATTSSGPLSYGYSHVVAVGGSSLHWNAHCPRPVADDLRVRSEFGYGRDWPFDYRELEPWLVAAERELGVSGNDDNPYASPRSAPFPMPAHPYSYFEREQLAPAFTAAGCTPHSRPHAINSVARDGRPACLACRMCTACPSGARYAADLVHLARLEQQRPDAIHAGLKLRALELAAQRGRGDGRIGVAHAVRVADGTPVAIRARRYVLAMGGVETPRMLLLSDIGTAGGHVGRGFTDHPFVGFSYSLRRRLSGRSLGFPAMYTEHFRSARARAAHNTFHVSVMPSPVEDDFEPVDKLVEWSIENDRLSLSKLRRKLRQTLIGWTIHEANDQGQLALDPEVSDDFGDPVAKITMAHSDRDREGVAALERWLPRLGDALDADELFLGGTGESPWFSSHPAGGTAMGVSADTGVCDPDAKVFGVDNLYLASSSLFPHQGANNPTLTTVALALRLVEHLGGAGSR
ncbi:GMC oxidoreductase [Haliangium ochraceum]|uniref:GMC oxidoreductase n=1 Tax=Haliangium ochraceum (strain DSM 14365 / JCM 11303 / SMP-2) TaxID=502025 RepID=D0LXW5_HALO1|nr:GMC family oxidoreductase [Haliangium ochraceum]ACY14320.1 GMC oxidoreductase [Haliangium ochraceum DSM 14365]